MVRLEPLIIEIIHEEAAAQLHVRSGHMILSGSITSDGLDQLAARCQAVAVELRRARNRIGADPYQVLGLSRSASAEEIQSAYRARAKHSHPDAATGDTAAMQRVNDAYQTLSDPVNKQQYDSTFI